MADRKQELIESLELARAERIEAPVDSAPRRVSLPDLAPTGPGSIAGRYLRLFWHPVCLADDLSPGQTRPLRIMSEDFVLYRGEGGAPHVLAPRCAHRRTLLHTGWVEGDCLRCYYHGWKYDGAGQCMEMPAEDPSFPPKVRIRSYPAREYLGLIFAYLGDGTPPPLPRYPEFEAFEGLLEHDPYWRRCNYFQSMENGFDATHLGFVHRLAPAAYDGLGRASPTIGVDETEWGIAAITTQPDGRRSVMHVGMPTLLNAVVFTTDPVVRMVESLFWRVPIEDDRHMVFHVKRVPLAGAEADGYRERLAARRARLDLDQLELTRQIQAGTLRLEQVDRGRTDVTRLEDGIAQEGQGPIVDREQERLGRGDVAIIKFRQLWLRELQALADGQPLRRWTRPAAMRPVSRE